MKQNLLRSKITYLLKTIILGLILLFVAYNQSNGQTTYTWQGANNASWAVAANWNPTRTTPATNDILQFNSGATLIVTGIPTQTIGKLLITNSSTITLRPQTAGNSNLTVSSVATNAISVEAGSTLIITGIDATTDRTLTLTTANSTGLEANISGTLIVGVDNNQVGAVGAFTKGGSNATIRFLSGSTYEHARNGGAIPTATWNAASTCKVTGITSTAITAITTATTFGNFVWDCPGQTVTNYLIGNAAITIIIAGDFSVFETNTNVLVVNAGNIVALQVSKNMIIGDGTNNAVLDLRNGNTNNVITTINLGGNLTVNSNGVLRQTNTRANDIASINFGFPGATAASSVTIGGAGTYTNTYINYVVQNVPTGKTVTLNTGLVIPTGRSFTVNSGATLDCGTNVISGAGIFTLNSGAGIITAHSQGLSTTASTGSIQVTGTKTYNVGANYTYNGTVLQSTGNGLPTSLTGNLTIANSGISGNNTVTLSQATTTSGIVNLTSGILTTTTNLLAVTNNAVGAVTSTSGYINGPLKWTLANGSSYIFPVGTSTTYYPFALNSVSGTTPVVTLQAFTANTGGSAGTGLCAISSSEYWQMTYGSGTFTNANVSLTRSAALSGLDAIGKSTSLTGSYTNLNGTANSPSINTSDNIGSLASGSDYFVMASKTPATPGTPTSNSPQCSDVGVTITKNGTVPAGETWYWQTSASGTSTANNATSAYNASATGTYYIRSRNNTTLCWSTAASIDVVVNVTPTTPTISAGGTTTFCSGSSVLLTSSSTIGNQWYLNGNPISGETNQTYTATASGSYTVVVTTSGCSSLPSAATIVTVNPLPDITTQPLPLTVCAGSPGTMTVATSATSPTYQWQYSQDGTNWTPIDATLGAFLNGYDMATLNFTDPQAGWGSLYTVRCVVTSGGCSTNSNAVQLTVNPLPEIGSFNY